MALEDYSIKIRQLPGRPPERGDLIAVAKAEESEGTVKVVLYELAELALDALRQGEGIEITKQQNGTTVISLDDELRNKINSLESQIADLKAILLEK